MADQETPRARFTRMDESTAADWSLIGAQFENFAAALPGRMLADLRAMNDNPCGFPLDRLSHSLQTATRALRDGRDDEYVLCALLHDIAEPIGSRNHPEVAAAMLRPFVTEANCWMVEQHGLFQGYYYFDKVGGDRTARERFRGHPHFERTAEFCALYDQLSFDPAYPSEPLEVFAPLVERILSSPRPG
jgi:predicted HD phosphohydrolase